MSLRRSEVSKFTRDILAVPVEGGLLIITKLTVRYTCVFGNVGKPEQKAIYTNLITGRRVTLFHQFYRSHNLNHI